MRREYRIALLGEVYYPQVRVEKLFYTTRWRRIGVKGYRSERSYKYEDFPLYDAKDYTQGGGYTTFDAAMDVCLAYEKWSRTNVKTKPVYYSIGISQAPENNAKLWP